MDKRRLVLTACLVAVLGISVAMAGPKVKRDAVSNVSIEEQKVSATTRSGSEPEGSNSSLDVAATPVRQSVSEEASRAIGESDQRTMPLVNPLGDPPVSVDLHPVAAAANFVIPWQSINAGGGPSSSASYSVNASVGQSTIGQASSANYGVGVGYWYGASVGGGDCACDCQGDEECNGLPTVFDLVFCVAEAFRNEPYSLDPNVTCPLLAQNDLNLDNVVNVFDVVFITTMAFRNGLREDNVCDPCTLVGPVSCPF